MFCLTVLSVVQFIQRREAARVINNELEVILEEVVMTQFKELSRHLARQTEKNHEKLVGVASNRGKIEIWNFPNINENANHSATFFRNSCLIWIPCHSDSPL
jgi:hypothetical protein